jgi:nucleoid DNA-binding protein
MPKKTINRTDLSKIIYARIGGSIPFNKIYQSVGLITEQISSDLISDQMVSVRNFGTLSPYVRVPHIAHNVNEGRLWCVKANRSVTFHPHEAFQSLIQDRREKFCKRDKEDS